MQNKVFGAMVAGTVAGLFISGSALANDAKAPAKDAKNAGEKWYCAATCHGKSECKGHGNNTCKGKNGCAGQGFITAANEKACAEKGGKWSKAK